MRLLEAAGTGAFELNLTTRRLLTTPQVSVLFGFDPAMPEASLADFERAIFFDDVPKLRAEMEAARTTGVFNAEMRVRHSDGKVHWLAARGEVVRDTDGTPHLLRGTCHDISERKALEVRLLALNEMLEARVAEVREEARTLEILNRTGVSLAAELDLERLVQIVTDAGVEITGAQFGAFFYNVLDDAGEVYTLYGVSGASREAFAGFPMPRNTAVFEPAFRGTGIVRSNDITVDARYGLDPPYPRHAAG